MHTQTHTEARKGTAEGLTLSKLRAEIRKDLKRYSEATTTVLEIAVHLGNNLRVAKTMVPYGQFMPWMRVNFSVSGTWLRVCMRAAEAWELLEKREDRAELLANATTVEQVALLLPLLKGKPPNITRGNPRRDDTIQRLRERVAYLEGLLTLHGIKFDK